MPEIKTIAEYGTLKLSSGRQIRARQIEIGGRRLADLRTFVPTAEGAWVPTRMGFAIRLENVGELAELVQAMWRGVFEPQGTKEPAPPAREAHDGRPVRAEEGD